MEKENLKAESYDNLIIAKAQYLAQLFHGLEAINVKDLASHSQKKMEFRNVLFPLQDLESATHIFSDFESASNKDRATQAQELYDVLTSEHKDTVEKAEAFLSWYKSEFGDQPTPNAAALAA